MSAGKVSADRVTPRRVLAAAGLAVLTFAAAPAPAVAQGKLEARYTVSIAGIPIGRGAWVVDVTDDHYTTAASGRVTGVLRAVTSGEGSAAARGTVSAGRLVPLSYAINITSDDKPEEIRMSLNGGTVKEVVAEPKLPPSPDRVPVTDTHRKGVLDPMTAGLFAVAGSGDPLVAEACHRTVPVFDGRQRYDLALSFKRWDKVKADKGYQGPVVVCAITYQPVAGHRPDRAAIKYLKDARDIEIWLAPLAGTRFLVPFRLAVPTMIGTAVLQATQFVSAPSLARPQQPPAPATGNAKTQ